MVDKSGKKVQAYERVTRNLLDLQRDTSDHLCRLNNTDYLKIKYHDYALTLTDTILAELFIVGYLRLLKKASPYAYSFLWLILSPTNWLNFHMKI